MTHDALPRMADEMQLIQLFQNLVGNGIKYQNAWNPRVHVSADKEAAEKWIFAVKDNGLGIEPQYFERIFGMFQRLHKREEFAGTGIGLAICKKIVERHGGKISVESQPGRVDLSALRWQAGRGNHERFIGGDAMPIQVLLVEDSPGDVRLTREAFRDANKSIHLHVATDGIEAMAFLRRKEATPMAPART